MTTTHLDRDSHEGRGFSVPLMTPAMVRQSMDNCTKCNVCQVHCPVAGVTDAFAGPKYAGPQAERFRIIDAVDETAPMLCSGCGICTSVCPNDVAITDIITLAKADQVDRAGGIGLGQRLLNRPELIGRLGSLAPWLANGVLANSLFRQIAAAVTGVSRDAPLPRFAGQRFRRWLKHLSQREGPQITYFSGCAVDHYDPDVGIAAVSVLNSLGYKVTVPPDACCSLPMLSSGDFETARPRARKMIELLTPSAGAGQTIVGTSTSCTLTLKSKYAAYLGFDDRQASEVAHAVSDICGYLLEHHADTFAKASARVPKRVLYHGPCQLRGHHIGQPALELLRLVPGITIELSQASCCGVAGTYGYDQEKRPIAVDVGRSLIEQIADSRPDLVICDSETCRWNIEQASGVPCLHPIQVLAQAMELTSGKVFQD